MKKENKKEILSPDEVFEKFLKWFDKRKRFAFITVIILGFIAHITMLTETIMSQDGLWNSMKYSRAGDWELTLGRWGIVLVEILNNFIKIPTIATISCIITMAIAAIFLVEVFDLKSKISILVTSAILVLTPTFTATVLYVYTSFAYCFNFLLAILAIWFLYNYKNKKLGFLLSSLCIMFSFSIYQSYIGVTIGLCLMIGIINTLKEKSNIKQVLFEILRTAGAVIVGGILYFIITMILLKISGFELATYKAVNTVGILDIFSNLKDSIIQAYKDFGIFFMGDSVVYNANYKRDIMYFVFFALFAILLLIKILKIEDNKKNKICKILVVVVSILVLPLALNIVDILAPKTKIYILTATQMILMIPFTFAIMEMIEKKYILKYASILCTVIIMGTYYLATNTSYSALKITYNQAYATTVRIMDRIENTPGYNKDLKILFGGIVGNNNFPRTSNLYGFTIGEIANNVVFHGTYGGQLGTWENYLKVFLGLDVTFCEDNVYRDIVTGIIYKEEMDVFPAANSIRIMDGIVVVKLSEDPPLPF